MDWVRDEHVDMLCSLAQYADCPQQIPQKLPGEIQRLLQVFPTNPRLKTRPYLLIAPLLEAIDDEYRDVRFKYSLWYQSPFKGPPTPQVEEAWHSIMQCNAPSLPLKPPSSTATDELSRRR